MLSVFLRSLRHLERHDVDFVLVRINMCRPDDVVPLVFFDCIWVADGPALAVRVAHKRLAVIANFARNLIAFLEVSAFMLSCCKVSSGRHSGLAFAVPLRDAFPQVWAERRTG